MVTKNVNFVFIAGDFNIELKDENSTKTDLEILIQSYGMNLLINDYTHNIITNYGHNCITDTIDLHTSDHRAQVLLFSIENNSKVTYTARRLFTRENIDNFIISLQRQDWDTVYSCNLAQVNRQWETFINIFSSIFNESFPVRHIKPRYKRYNCFQIMTCVTAKANWISYLYLQRMIPSLKSCMIRRKRNMIVY
nr:unnamed protein product [Callosobruchus analis]